MSVKLSPAAVSLLLIQVYNSRKRIKCRQLLDRLSVVLCIHYNILYDNHWIFQNTCISHNGVLQSSSDFRLSAVMSVSDISPLTGRSDPTPDINVQ